MRLLLPLTLTALLPLSALAQEPMPELPVPVAGTYHLEREHSRVLFKFNHLGFSTYIAPFTGVEATLQFDPETPTDMKLEAKIDAASVETLYPTEDFDMNGLITGPDLLDAKTHPEITFTSTKIEMTGDKTADVTGDLTLRGITKPVTLRVTYNGGWGNMPMDPSGARIGFSATGSFNRSDFGMTWGVPAPGTTLGVWDEIKLEIETEFTSKEAAVPMP